MSAKPRCIAARHQEYLEPDVLLLRCPRCPDDDSTAGDGSFLDHVGSQHPDLASGPGWAGFASHEQLVQDVRGIYKSLLMVEAECVDVDKKHTAAAQEEDPSRKTTIASEHRSALIALHTTLLYKHHDFFLASQHSSASPALKRLAETCSMPARMWKHGIEPFLEILRVHLPSSFDDMLLFIYIAYSVVTLLHDTVNSFEDTWAECLGDLARYRMAIGNSSSKDYEVWNKVASFWYKKVMFKSPQVGAPSELEEVALLTIIFRSDAYIIIWRFLRIPTPFSS